MSRVNSAIALALVAAIASAARAQSAAAYRQRVDSLVARWRPLVAAQQTQTALDSVRRAQVPADSLRVGAFIVRAESPYVRLGRETAERLMPRVTHFYGATGNAIASHQFVLRARPDAFGQQSVATGVVDSAGVTRLRSAVYVNEEALENVWAQDVAEIVTDRLGPDVRDWISMVIPIDPQSRSEWSQARVDFLLSSADVARKCAMTDVSRCAMALGVQPSADPAFDHYTADQRRELVVANGSILRRANPAEFDRCVNTKVAAVCDSLTREIPVDVVPRPFPPRVRQSFVRYALELGGEGAFDRLAKPGTIAERVQAASGLPVDTVIVRWRTKLLYARSTSTALDATTVVSSIFWVTLCACLALRSSRWR